MIRTARLHGRIALSTLAASLWAVSPCATPSSIEVFTDSRHPMTHMEALPGATIYQMDAVANAAEEMSMDLPANQEQALAEARARFAARRNRNAALVDGARGLTIAHFRYGLDRYPAVVVDGKWIIYGVTDLAVARDIVAKATAGEAP